jgi:hypothetical protein
MRHPVHALALLLALTAAGCHLTGRRAASVNDLPGVWQDHPELASGWSDAFQFFQDGRFVFHHNQMDCGKRETSYEGRFGIRQSLLTLTIERRYVLTGGHFEGSVGSCASDSTLVDAQEQIVALAPAVIETVAFSPPETVMVRRDNYRSNRQESQPMLQITLGGRPYWKLKDDPNAYR